MTPTLVILIPALPASPWIRAQRTGSDASSSHLGSRCLMTWLEPISSSMTSEVTVSRNPAAVTVTGSNLSSRDRMIHERVKKNAKWIAK